MCHSSVFMMGEKTPGRSEPSRFLKPPRFINRYSHSKILIGSFLFLKFFEFYLAT